jgi:hypothetical protein
MKHPLLLLIVTTAMASAAVAQVGQRPARPPRDVGGSRVQAAASATIAGRVTVADTGAPLRRVEVTAEHPETFPRVTITDDEGRYELPGLEPGPWRLQTLKTGYISLQFGQRRPFGPAEPIRLSAGDRAIADFALTRSSAINGRIYDEYGEPLAGIRINVMRSRMVQKRRRLEAIGEGDHTDDTGAFRIYGLPPGEYYVSASLRVAPIESVIRTTYSPTYYPGTGNVAEAQRVLLGPGSEATIDFPLLPFRTARVSGTVLTSSGAPAAAYLNLAAEGGELGVALGVGGVTREDGGFTLADVPPGSYTLNVTLRNDNSPSAESAAVAVTLYGDDVEGVTLVTARPPVLRGTVVADAGVTRRLPASINVAAHSTRTGGDSTYKESERNAFDLLTPPGPFRLEVDVPEGWMVKRLEADGIDALDVPLDLKGQQEVPLRVVLTDRLTELTGVVSGGSDVRAPTVVVFPEDTAKWMERSRFVRSAEASPGGQYRIVGLPPGERYRIVAIDDLEADEGDDPDLLARVRERATAIIVTEGGKHVVDLTVVPR